MYHADLPRIATMQMQGQTQTVGAIVVDPVSPLRNGKQRIAPGLVERARKGWR